MIPENLGKNLKEDLKKIQSDFDDYQNKCFAPKTSPFFCLELNGEAGELANLEKKDWKGKSIAFERFEDEAADVFIALVNYCNTKGIDLGKSVSEKLEKIESKRLEMLKNGEKY